MAGLSPTGFVKRALEDLLQQVEDDEHSLISEALDTSSSSPMGQINAVLTKADSELWDLAQDEYVANDPDRATGDALDAICAITGTVRLPATKSQARLELGLNAGVTVPVGAIVAVFGNPTVRFLLVGLETVAGTVVPGDVTSAGAGSYFARFEAESAGPTVANAGTLSVIVTPVGGWNSVTNGLDAVVGRAIESDSDLRIRRENELEAEGTSPADAIRAKLLELTGMQQVTVFENDLDVSDANGLPPHSFEALCYDGPSPLVADTTIAQTIWNNKAAGIQTFGGTSANATDTQGNLRAVNFSRPTQRPIYFDITITDVDGYPGDAALKTAIATFGLTLKPGDDVVLAAFYAAIFGVGGVTDVTSFKAGFAPSPSGTVNLTIAARELATFDTSRITIHS